MPISILFCQTISPKSPKTCKSNSLEISGTLRCYSMLGVLGQSFVFCVEFCTFASSCSPVLITYCRILFTFCCFQIMLFWFFSRFLSIFVQFVEFGRIAFHFLSYSDGFCLFWSISVCFVANFSWFFRFCPFRVISLPIVFIFWAAFCQFYGI